MVNTAVGEREELRKCLGSHLKICQQKDDFSELIGYIRKLPSEYTKRIRVKSGGNHRSRCFDFVFGVAVGHKSAVSELIKNTNLIRELRGKEEKFKDDIVVYFLNHKPIHAGKVIGSNKIISKWETGPIIEHEVFIAPINYGNDIKYYRIINKKGVNNFLKKFPTMPSDNIDAITLKQLLPSGATQQAN